MYIVKKNNFSLLFALFAIFFVSLFVFVPNTSAIVQTGEQDSFIPAIYEACKSTDNSITTSYKSPFLSYCLGKTNQLFKSPMYFWQLQVKFRGDVKDSIISGTNGSNPKKQILFIPATESRTMSTSAHGGDSYVNKNGMGYGIYIDLKTDINYETDKCIKRSDGNNIITVSATGNGTKDDRIVDLCSILDSAITPLNGIVQISLDKIKTDAEVISKDTSQIPGRILGHIGILRNNIPTEKSPISDSVNKTPIMPAGIKSIELIDTSRKPESVYLSSMTSGANWYSLTNDGNLSIYAKTGTYRLEIHYNDQVAARLINRYDPLLGYLGQDEMISFNDIKVYPR